MSFNRLTIQSLQAERQRAAYAGLSGLGETRIDASYLRPSVDYVRAGDVIRVYIAINPGLYFGGANEAATFMQKIQSSLNVIHAPTDASGYFGSRAWVVDVQARGDYARLADVTSIVLSVAQASGLSVNPGTSYGQFVSKVETTGTTPPTTLPTPGANLPAAGSGIGDSVSSFLSSLTQSPVTLAVIAGAAVILVIAAKK